MSPPASNEGPRRLSRLYEAFGDTQVQLWFCPVEHPWERRPRLTQTVEWDGDVATCLWRGCWRRSDDPDPRRECLCEEYDCAGECCGAGQCSCSQPESGVS